MVVALAVGRKCR